MSEYCFDCGFEHARGQHNESLINASAEQAPAGQVESKIIDPSNRELVIDDLRSQLTESRRCHKVQFDANVEMQKDLSRVELLLGIDPHGSESLIDGVRRIKAGHKLEVESRLATHAREDEALAQLSTTREMLAQAQGAAIDIAKAKADQWIELIKTREKVDQLVSHCDVLSERWTTTREIARELAAACEEQQIRLKDLFDRHERRSYSRECSASEDLDLLLATGNEALAKARASGLLDAQRPAETTERKS